MSIPAPEVDQLIRRVRGGSASALGTLLDRYREYLLRIADERIESGLRPKMAASDVVQGSLLIASERIRQFRGGTEQQFRAWLVSILTSQLIDGLRRFTEAEKRRADRELKRGDSLLKRTAARDVSPSQAASLHEEAAQLLESIQSLGQPQRDIVQARYLEGLTFGQIADRLSIPVTTCRRYWLEALDAIGQKGDPT